ncbi:MAG TPA: ATP-binding cassette domain-containing protein [Nitrospira sp.]|nr:ATP-binding cassette domain-containing protein [Nitrospira sp.]
MNGKATDAGPMTTTPTPVVKVEQFVKRYKKHVAVQDVKLTVKKGEIYGLIGPDGAGKSSLMKAVAGVLAYEGGVVEVLGIPVDSEATAERVKARIGFLPQGLGLNLYPELSVEENIDFFAQLRLVPEDQLAERKARLLGMTRLDKFRDRAMKHLSGGMKQKLGLICTLIHEPEFAILDEPTTGVDPVSRRDFWAILTELIHTKGMTALVSTAYMDEAVRFHRLSFLSQGKVLAAGTPGEVQELVPGSVLSFQATPQLEAVARLKRRYRQVEALGPKVHVFTEETDHAEAVRSLEVSLGDIKPNQTQVRDPDLEDVFVALLLRQATTHEAFTSPAASGQPRTSGLAIEARDLVRDFGQFRAVDRVSFLVKSGEIFGLLGANGAGKTTVIKMLNGIMPPTGGEGWVAGADMKTAGGTIKERIGYVSQAFSLYLDLTVVENIRLFAGIYGLDRTTTSERLDWLVSMAGLKGYESNLTGRLPMGVRQRLALGCALVHRPQVLFLDEPTSGVDPIGRRHFWDILSRLAREEGVAILITTHYMNEAEHCDHLALMYAGRIVAEGSPEAMKQQVEREAGSLLELTTDRPGETLQQLVQAGFGGAALFGTKIHLLSKDPAQEQTRLHAALSPRDLQVRGIAVRPLTLEDVFVHRVMTLERREEEAVRGEPL